MSNQLTIATLDPRIRAVCDEIEAAVGSVAGIPPISGTLEVEILSDFLTLAAACDDGTPQGKVLRQFYERSPAVFQKSTGKVLINETVFFADEVWAQRATLAHEAAHAIRHLAGIDGGYDDEPLTDILGCRLGFSEELVRERRRAAPARADALLLWEDEMACLAAFERWRQDNLRKRLIR
jgi:hypothetical protein